MGCAASHSQVVLRKHSIPPVVPPSEGNRFLDHRTIDDKINLRRSETSQSNVNADVCKGDNQKGSPTEWITSKTKDSHTAQDSKRLTTKNVIGKKGTTIEEQLKALKEICSEDPILKKLWDELMSSQGRPVTCTDTNKMIKLMSKIDRYQRNRLTDGDSKVRTQPPSKTSLQKGSGLDFLVNEVLSGKVDAVCPSNDKIVRVFTSSTFTDTEHERNYLMENVYPKLKVFCQKRGYQFQIVDMRWGIRDEATNDHMTTELCLKELELCQKVSTGPNFVSFLSHKYGYRPCPRTIRKEQFEKFLKATENPDDKSFLLRWYREDKNTLECLYILQPVGHILHDFCSLDSEKKTEAKNQWWEESERLRHILTSLAKRLLTKEDARLFLMSVTEIEITNGLVNINTVDEHCLWFKRNILDIEHQEYDDVVKKYRECSNVSEDFKESQDLLQNLKVEIISRKLPTDNILSYDITWTPKGVDPAANKEHRNYLTTLGRDFQQRLQDMIEKSIAKKNKAALNDPLYEEVKKHTLFCQKKCKTFSGRNDALKRIKDYVQGPKSEPLVIYGKSGSGKTSIMAKAAMNMSDWMNGEAVIILRFIGTTLSSSDANSLMVSIIHQIQYIFSCPQPISANPKEIENQFHESLKKGSATKQLILILDSLDQLSATSAGRQLAWLMTDSLPKHIKLILSTLPEKQHVCFPQLQSWIKDTSQFWEVPRLPTEDVSGILEQWLQAIGQTLTKEQRDTVLQAFNQCPLPLFLKLSFDVARGWHSYPSHSVTVLEKTVRDSIKSLFNRIEVKHGKILVSHALGYLTLAENGLSELELEDILSCDEDVLNDVYMYWTPPIRRLPPLLLVRIKNDLEEYLVNRGSDGVQVIDWYHRQFIEVATEIYCSDAATNELLYAGLVNYFSGKWANGIPKPYVNKDGTSGECDRLLTQQPIKFDNAPNLRKLNNLPHLLAKAKMATRLKEEVLFNQEFLLAKMKANSFREVLDDFLFACETFPQDEAILTVTEALQLSQDALSYDPDQLSTQLIGRLPELPELHPLLEACRKSNLPYFEADHKVLFKPGGKLLHCIPAHKREITSFDISSDKKTAVTLSAQERCIKFWDTVKGQPILKYDGFKDTAEKVQFCDDDRLVAINPNTDIVFIFTETASLSHYLDIKSLTGNSHIENRFFQVCAQQKSWILFHTNLNLIICDIKTSEKKYAISLSKEETHVIDPSISAAASNRFVALSLSTEPSKILTVNLQTGTVDHLNGTKFFSKADSFSTAIALCPKSDMLYFSGLENEDLFCYDLSISNLVKTLQGNKWTTSENFRIADDGLFIYYIADKMVKMWDLSLGENATVIAQESLQVIDVGIISEKIIITTSLDANLRIWNRARDFRETTIKVNFDQVQDIKLLPNARYLLFMTGFGPFYWYVYDVTTYEILMELQLVRLVESSFQSETFRVRATGSCQRHVADGPWERVVGFGTAVGVLCNILEGLSMVYTCSTSTTFPLSSTQIAVVSTSCKLKVVDLESCSITKVFQGKVNPSSCFLLIKNAKEILTTNHDKQNLKVYNTETGNTIEIIQGNDQPINHISINKSDSMAVAFTEDDCILVVDMVLYKRLYALKPESIEFCHGILVNQEPVQISGDGSLLIIMVNMNREGNEDDDIFCTVIWNIAQEKSQCYLFDKEYHERYKARSVDVVSATLMQNDEAVLSTHDDYIIRVFSTTSGELLRRIVQHYNVPVLLFSPNESLPYFASWVESDEEIAFCLWRKETYEKVATLKLDEKPKKVALSMSGDIIIGRGKTTDDHLITLWKLKNEIIDPELFSNMKNIDIFKKHGNGNKLKMTTDDDDDDADDTYRD